MDTKDFDYHLPPELVAQHPPAQRDGSRMMVVHREEERIEHAQFIDLPEHLCPQDLLVLNDTRVYPARVIAHKAETGGAVELLFLEELEDGVWDVLLRASRRPKPGSRLILGQGAAETILLTDGEQGRAIVRIESDRALMDVLAEVGQPPLPPYIKRSGDDGDWASEDGERYQTIFAREVGAMAAPTAGLHFTPEMFERLSSAGVQQARLTLHVGIGTFRPVAVDSVEDHVMEAERYRLGEETAQKILDTTSAGGRIVAVGSTTVRVLETVAMEQGTVVPCEGRTELFIYPPYQPRVIGAMLTNFHLPRSTLLMMVCALGGTDLVLRAYSEAVQAGYRFYSYGDCMLIV